MPLLALLVAVFSIPSALGDNGTLAWALVSYALFSLAYSFVNIPYGSLSAAMTQEPDARAKLSTSRVVCCQPHHPAHRGRRLPADRALGRSAALADGDHGRPRGDRVRPLPGVFRHLARGGAAPGEKTSVRETVSMMRHNRPLVLLCASSLLFLTGMFSLSTVAVYYARDVLGNADLYIVMTVVQTVAMVAAAALVPKAVATVGKKRAYLLAGVVAVVGAVGVRAGAGIGAGRSGSPAMACSGSGWASSTR